MFGTGLAKDLSPPMRAAWSLLGTPVLGWPLRRLNPTLNSRAAAGNTLADLALGLAQTLWNDSARLVGLPD